MCKHKQSSFLMNTKICFICTGSPCDVIGLPLANKISHMLRTTSCLSTSWSSIEFPWKGTQNAFHLYIYNKYATVVNGVSTQTTFNKGCRYAKTCLFVLLWMEETCIMVWHAIWWNMSCFPNKVANHCSCHYIVFQLQNILWPQRILTWLWWLMMHTLTVWTNDTVTAAAHRYYHVQ